MIPKQNIFRAYDIRGTYPYELDDESAFLIGRAFAQFLIINKGISKPRVVVGRDNRPHGVGLQSSFIKGLVASGCRVSDAGLSPSPYLYFCDAVGEFDAACNVTASHNPKDYNGFKLMLNDGHAVFGDDLQLLFSFIQENRFIEGAGSFETVDFTDAYIQKLVSLFKTHRHLKIVVDTANGVAGSLYPRLLRALGYEVIELFTESDGTFPNHEPDPIVEQNLFALKQKVLEIDADVGIAFDGDGDRMSVVTERGKFINADNTLMLFARDALARHPGNAIVFTVSNSQSFFDLVPKWGGKPVMTKVGHSYVEHTMTAENAIVGGEQSGHYFLPENYYSFDDALVAACRFLKIVSDSGNFVSHLFQSFPVLYSEPEMRPECNDDCKFSVIDRISDYFSRLYSVNTMDGVRIDFGHGSWAAIRASNTSPRISIIMESLSREDLNRIRSIIMDHLKSYPEIRF